MKDIITIGSKKELKNREPATYMMNSTDLKFFYIAPSLAKADSMCRVLQRYMNMVMPYTGLNELIEAERDPFKYYGSQVKLIMKAMDKGRNISTTNSILKYTDASFLNKIKEQGYVVVIDNVPNNLEETNFDIFEFGILRRAGALEVVNGYLKRCDGEEIPDDYNGFYRIAIEKADEDAFVVSGEEDYSMWSVSPELVRSSRFTVMFSDNENTTSSFESFCGKNNIKFNKHSY